MSANEVYMSSILFETLSELPEDPILGMAKIVRQDARKEKIDLSIGIYRDQNGLSEPMAVVKAVEREMAHQTHSKVYLPIEGDAGFIQSTAELLWGSRLYQNHQERIVGIQTVGGTSAIALAAEFFYQVATKKVYVSNPTWPNHFGIFKRAGFQVETYPYYDMKSPSVKFQEMIDFLKHVEPGSLVVLHGCCHNPSGFDLYLDQWSQLIAILRSKKLIPVIDTAYLGLGDGLEQDRRPLILLLEAGIPMAVALSFSKNFGLYAERVGTLLVLDQGPGSKNKILSHLKGMIRTNYSNPPLHGAKIVATILANPAYRKAWEEELKIAQQRMKGMRARLMEGLQSVATRYDWSYLNQVKGMFSYLDLSAIEVEQLKNEHAIYLLSTGRINFSGLNEGNIDRVIKAICQVKRIHA